MFAVDDAATYERHTGASARDGHYDGSVALEIYTPKNNPASESSVSERQFVEMSDSRQFQKIENFNFSSVYNEKAISGDESFLKIYISH
jgi:hypothetical protein